MIFENKVFGRILESETEEVTGGMEKIASGAILICVSCQILRSSNEEV